MKKISLRLFGITLGLFVFGCVLPAYAAETALTSDNYHHTYPKWSPDGNWIVYSKTDASGWGQIYKVPATGGPEVAVTSGIYHRSSPNWSPDGNWIVYLKDDATTYDQVYKVPSDGSVGIGLYFQMLIPRTICKFTKYLRLEDPK
jgi:dipeptidyl aminopeptidase/acylaminoacyl peptidase